MMSKNPPIILIGPSSLIVILLTLKMAQVIKNIKHM